MLSTSVGAVSAVLIWLSLAGGAAAQSTCSGFVLLDFKSQADIALNKYRGWPGYLQNLPITLSYQFDDEFMDFLPTAQRDQAIQAVINAMQSWSDATNGHLSFVPSPWVAVENRDSIVDGGCWSNFEGPSCEQWEQLGFPLDNLPGWGANIDFFTKPVGFTITSGELTYQMTPGILGFAVVDRSQGSALISSVDIYLNEAWAWTTNTAHANQQAPSNAHPIQYACETAHRVEHRDSHTKHSRNSPDTLGLTPVFDVETVMLHELGHALGLDHPNEAQSNGGALINPFTFGYLAGNCWASSAVMHGDYTGIKRDLKPSDIGGMAFLYIPATPGDINASGDVDPADAFTAIQHLGGNANPSPYDVNIMDFVTRDGVICDLETSSVVQWAFDGMPGAGIIPSWNPAPLQSLPSALVVTPSICPPVMVAGSTATLSLYLENPNRRNIRMWTIEARYDPSTLANPRIADGSIFNDAIWITPEQEPGKIRFARISIYDEENAPAGSVARIEFDVLGAPSASAPKPAKSSLTLTDARIVVTDPVLHVFGNPDAGESLIVHPIPILFADLDVTGDGRVGTEDWYAFLDSPTDFNGDLIIDTQDEKLFLSYMRQSEIADITSDLVAPDQAETNND